MSLADKNNVLAYYSHVAIHGLYGWSRNLCDIKYPDTV